MTVNSSTKLVEQLQQHQLLEPTLLDEVSLTLVPHCRDSRSLAKELVRRRLLTAYQMKQVFQGRAAALTLGNYVLLESLGEGGMGQVFKARHRKLGHIVALKLIRKERLSNPDMLRRFRREMQAASQLEHPHIVRALDADEVDGTLFFAMEYVEGSDLAKVVQKRGALPCDEACRYIRQAALGLQHAHERGLVHRDIKPHNLLLAKRDGTIKLLDLGLARLASVGDEHSSILTREGSVMGTPDYLAPEQARNSHEVDIRADLYSLGCTFYFLLTGRVPFPGGMLAEKLLQHQFDEPVPIRQQRSEVPPGVAAVVQKLMAKRPDDRYQTPDELAVALETIPTEEPIDIIVAPLIVPRLTEPPRKPAAWLFPALSGGATVIFLVALIVVGTVLLVRSAVNRSTKFATVTSRGDKSSVPKEDKPPLPPVVNANDKPPSKNPGDLKPSEDKPPPQPMKSGEDKPPLKNPEVKPTPTPDEEEAQAAVALELLGATLVRDTTQPGKPIVEFRLDGSTATDAALRPLKNLRHLKLLQIGNAPNITAEGLTVVEALTELTVVEFNKINLGDEGVRHLVGLKKLTNVALIKVGMTDAALAELVLLPKLRSLRLTANPITDEGLLHLKKVPALIFLAIAQTKVTDAGLVVLAELPNLNRLFLSQTGLTNKGMQHLKELKKLRALMINNTQIDDEGLKALYGLTQLEVIHLQRTRVTASGIEKLQKALPNAKIER